MSSSWFGAPIDESTMTLTKRLKKAVDEFAGTSKPSTKLLEALSTLFEEVRDLLKKDDHQRHSFIKSTEKEEQAKKADRVREDERGDGNRGGGRFMPLESSGETGAVSMLVEGARRRADSSRGYDGEGKVVDEQPALMTKAGRASAPLEIGAAQYNEGTTSVNKGVWQQLCETMIRYLDRETSEVAIEAGDVEFVSNADRSGAFRRCYIALRTLLALCNADSNETFVEGYLESLAAQRWKWDSAVMLVFLGAFSDHLLCYVASEAKSDWSPFESGVLEQLLSNILLTENSESNRTTVRKEEYHKSTSRFVNVVMKANLHPFTADVVFEKVLNCSRFPLMLGGLLLEEEQQDAEGLTPFARVLLINEQQGKTFRNRCPERVWEEEVVPWRVPDLLNWVQAEVTNAVPLKLIPFIEHLHQICDDDPGVISAQGQEYLKRSALFATSASLDDMIVRRFLRLVKEFELSAALESDKEKFSRLSTILYVSLEGLFERPGREEKKAECSRAVEEALLRVPNDRLTDKVLERVVGFQIKLDDAAMHMVSVTSFAWTQTVGDWSIDHQEVSDLLRRKFSARIIPRILQLRAFDVILQVALVLDPFQMGTDIRQRFSLLFAVAAMDERRCQGPLMFADTTSTTFFQDISTYPWIRSHVIAGLRELAIKKFEPQPAETFRAIAFTVELAYASSDRNGGVLNQLHGVARSIFPKFPVVHLAYVCSDRSGAILDQRYELTRSKSTEFPVVFLRVFPLAMEALTGLASRPMASVPPSGTSSSMRVVEELLRSIQTLAPRSKILEDHVPFFGDVIDRFLRCTNGDNRRGFGMWICLRMVRLLIPHPAVLRKFYSLIEGLISDITDGLESGRDGAQSCPRHEGESGGLSNDGEEVSRRLESQPGNQRSEPSLVQSDAFHQPLGRRHRGWPTDFLRFALHLVITECARYDEYEVGQLQPLDFEHFIASLHREDSSGENVAQHLNTITLLKTAISKAMMTTTVRTAASVATGEQYPALFFLMRVLSKAGIKRSIPIYESRCVTSLIPAIPNLNLNGSLKDGRKPRPSRLIKSMFSSCPEVLVQWPLDLGVADASFETQRLRAAVLAEYVYHDVLLPPPESAEQQARSQLPQGLSIEQRTRSLIAFLENVEQSPERGLELFELALEVTEFRQALLTEAAQRSPVLLKYALQSLAKQLDGIKEGDPTLDEGLMTAIADWVPRCVWLRDRTGRTLEAALVVARCFEGKDDEIVRNLVELVVFNRLFWMVGSGDEWTRTMQSSFSDVDMPVVGLLREVAAKVVVEASSSSPVLQRVDRSMSTLFLHRLPPSLSVLDLVIRFQQRIPSLNDTLAPAWALLLRFDSCSDLVNKSSKPSLFSRLRHIWEENQLCVTTTYGEVRKYWAREFHWWGFLDQRKMTQLFRTMEVSLVCGFPRPYGYLSLQLPETVRIMRAAGPQLLGAAARMILAERSSKGTFRALLGLVTTEGFLVPLGYRYGEEGWLLMKSLLVLCSPAIVPRLGALGVYLPLDLVRLVAACLRRSPQ